MIDVQQVRELIELMVEHGLSEVRIREGETAINLRKGAGDQVQAFMAPPQYVQVPPPAVPQPTAGTPTAATPAATPADEGLIPIVSPMVGTFYAAADPESPPFVTVGSQVDVNSVICIIEAMKVFNEIKGEVAGTVERILVSNEQAVEFGQPLMLVRPR